MVDGFAVLREADQAVEEARVRGDTALDPEQLEKLRQRYDEAAAFRIDAIRAALKGKPWLPPLPRTGLTSDYAPLVNGTSGACASDRIQARGQQ